MKIFRLLSAISGTIVGLILVTPVFIFVFPIWLVSRSACLIKKLLQRFEPKSCGWMELIEFEPVIGWKPKANLNTYVKADKVYHITTDSDGWRGKAKLNNCDIIVFGDSFAFGYGIDDRRFFANLNSELKIKPIGVNGYNMVQEFLLMDRFSQKLRGKLVVWFIYHGNDLYENLKPNLDNYRMPFVRNLNGTRTWEIVTSHICSEKWTNNSKRQYYRNLADICTCGTYIGERAYSACDFLIRKAHVLCDLEKARLVVMTIPDISQINKNYPINIRDLSQNPQCFDFKLPDIKIGQICSNLTIPFVALRKHLKSNDYNERNGHWNERGHRQVANLIYTLYKE